MARLTPFLLTVVLATGCMDWDGLDGKVQLTTEVDDWRDEVIYQVLVDRFDNGDRGVQITFRQFR